MQRTEAERIADAVLVDVNTATCRADLRRDHTIKSSIIKHLCPPVKPLTWEQVGRGTWKWGAYEIDVSAGGSFYFYCNGEDLRNSGPFLTLNEAKAAAQSHSEAKP